MNGLAARWMTALLPLGLPAPAAAEIQVVWERNAGQTASAAFPFKAIPAPSASDAATNAEVALIAGEADPNGADADALVDGQLPTGSDQPGANFFFRAGSPGGRILLDLRQVTAIRRVTTYSWHPGGRGPQVYRLYGSDGADGRFQARPAREADPLQSGWTLIAAVDTRPKEGERGGQYGVRIADASGAPLGRYRYLLLDASSTDPADRFGQTFYSEIDVDDGAVHAAKPRPPGIAIDYSETPELKDWVETKLRPVLETWYPKIVAMLPSEGYRAPSRLTVTIQKDMEGVAYTAGTRVVCAGPWFKKNLEGEAVGAVIHELVHVVQQYGRVRGGAPNPGWLVEGVADYIRWFLYEPPHLRPKPDRARAKYTDSYRVTAAFLNHLMTTENDQIVKRLNAAMREGRYRPELWTELTGKTVDELWARYVEAGGTR